MNSSYHLGRVFGVPVGLNPSWFIAFGLIMFVLAQRVYPMAIPARGADIYWAMAFISGVLFFGSILAHELAHSVVAKAYGIPVNGITLFILGGVSQIAREAPRARQEFLMAFAGPAVSFVLAGLALAAWIASGPSNEPLTVVLEWLWLMNFGVGLFNLVPGFPLDGGRVLRAALWGMSGSYSGATRWSAYVGRGIAWLMMAYAGASLVAGGDAAWATDVLGAIWLFLIAVFLEVAARSTWVRTRTLLSLRQWTVGDVVEPRWPMVASIARLGAMEEEGLVAEEDDHVLVCENGSVIGVIPGPVALAALDAGRDPTASELMLAASSLPALALHHSAYDAWERMEGANVDFLPVVDGSAFAGLVRRDGLVRLIRPRPVPSET